MAQFPQSYSDTIAQRARQRKPRMAIAMVLVLALAGFGGYKFFTRDTTPHLTVHKVNNVQDLNKLSDEVSSINAYIKTIDIRK